MHFNKTSLPRNEEELCRRFLSLSLIKKLLQTRTDKISLKPYPNDCEQATSPNGKFKEGAKAIHNRPLSRIEAIGKNLFYFWGEKRSSSTVVHIHFGMSGQFKTAGLAALEAGPNTRLQLVNEEEDICAHLSAMTVQHGAVDFYEAKKQSLGQDPLREDADKELVWEAFKKSRKSVGLLLMDQSVIAGLGNIYRAEVLFKAGVHPEQPGNTIDYESFNNIWEISKDLLYRGFQTGSILTVDAKENLPPPWTRRYVYNHSSCGRCGSSVRTWNMSGRTCYACPTCQQLRKGTSLSAETASKLRKAKQHVPFVSHCAPEPRKYNLNNLTVKELRAMASKYDLPLTGKKADLVDRLTSCPDFEMRVEPKDGVGCNTSSTPATALDAALEKIQAGEKRNVEHIALVDESTIKLGKLSGMTVKQLKQELVDLNLSTGGDKQTLIKRLAEVKGKNPGSKSDYSKTKGRLSVGKVKHEGKVPTGKIPFRQSKRRKQK